MTTKLISSLFGSERKNNKYNLTGESPRKTRFSFYHSLSYGQVIQYRYCSIKMDVKKNAEAKKTKEEKQKVDEQIEKVKNILFNSKLYFKKF